MGVDASRLHHTRSQRQKGREREKEERKKDSRGGREKEGGERGREREGERHRNKSKPGRLQYERARCCKQHCVRAHTWSSSSNGQYLRRLVYSSRVYIRPSIVGELTRRVLFGVGGDVKSVPRGRGSCRRFTTNPPIRHKHLQFGRKVIPLSLLGAYLIPLNTLRCIRKRSSVLLVRQDVRRLLCKAHPRPCTTTTTLTHCGDKVGRRTALDCLSGASNDVRSPL